MKNEFKGRKKSNSKMKSTLLFTGTIVLILALAWVGAFGVKIGDYKVESFGDMIKKGLDLQGGVSLVEEIQEDKVDAKTLERTMSLISTRINKLGVTEPDVKKEGTKRIRIEIPGVYDAQSVLDTVGKTGELKFVGPDNVTILTGKDVKDATAMINPESNRPEISLELNAEGTTKFSQATQKFIGQKIAIYLDEEKLTDPTVQSHITGGKASISGNYTMDEAKKQASLIKSGALPVAVKAVQVQTVGATLGKESLPLSVKAGIVGFILVFLFMILNYRTLGLIANIALILFAVLVLGVFSIIGVTLTLSGIAAFLLNVGMAVDANILIFERTREELRSGKSIKSAVKAGFNNALSSIVDSNLTTIITALVLYFFGTGTVKGFALTLVIGVLISMFTAIVVTRFLLNQAVEMGLLKSLWSFGVKKEVENNA